MLLLKGEERAHKLVRPAHHIIPFKPGLHRSIAIDLLFLGHLQGLFEGVGDLFDVGRIDDNRLSKLLGGPRHVAKDQYARLIGSGGHVFLCDQVHPVSERRD